MPFKKFPSLAKKDARLAKPALTPVNHAPEPDPTRSDLGALDATKRNEIYEAAKRADHEIPKLQATPMAQLLALAKEEGLADYAGLTKQELIFEILRRRVTSTGLGWGEGVLDVLPDGFGFLRSSRYAYEPGPDDIYVSPSQIRRLNLRQGHLLAGPVRPPKEGEKYFALLHIEAVNGGPVERMRNRIPFDELTPVVPDERFQLDRAGTDIDVRMLDLLAPMGKGQRTLLMTPPMAGRSVLLTNLAQALLDAHPEIYVILLVVDERPEDVTEMVRRTGPDHRREVAATCFDEPTNRHVALASIVTEKARRMVESGMDVVVLVDSLTQLTRAYNSEVPHSGKIIAAGLDAVALQEPKRLFGSARKVEEGGSLTIVATALTDTGSHMNDIICEEFRGKGNAEIVLDRELAEMHAYPAINIGRTATTREERLIEAKELIRLRKLRKQLSDLSPKQALEKLQQMLKKFPTNAELLASL